MLLAVVYDSRMLEAAAFIAEVGGEAVGSAACQVFRGLYLVVFQADKRKYACI